MDNVLELAARATSYLVLLQDALALVSAGLPLPLWRLPTAELPTLHTAINAEPMLSKKAAALVESATGLPVQSSEGELELLKLASFNAHVLKLLEFVRQRQQFFLPKQPEVAPPPPPHPQPQPFRAPGQPAAKRAATPPPPPADPVAMPEPHYLAPETWRQALQQVLYQDPASRVALAQALDYVPLLVYELIGAPSREVHASPLARLKHWAKKQWRSLRLPPPPHVWLLVRLSPGRITWS